MDNREEVVIPTEINNRKTPKQNRDEFYDQEKNITNSCKLYHNPIVLNVIFPGIGIDLFLIGPPWCVFWF